MMAHNGECEEQVILIDCDPGADDLLAIMMAFAHAPQVKVAGITCVSGNVDIDNVVLNTMRTLKLFDVVGKVPVFKGCDSALFPEADIDRDFYGIDGFGDVPHIEPSPDKEWLKLVEKEHAANAIVRLSKEYAGGLKIVAIGPLTNLSLAVKLDPELPSRLHSLHILGGTSRGEGNMSMGSEFNFYVDPEAARIVLHCFSEKCDVQVVTLETCCDHVVAKEWHEAWLANCSTSKGLFFREVFKHIRPVEGGPQKTSGFCIYDAYSMCTALRPEAVLKYKKVRACVEVGGIVSRGNLLFDHMNFGGRELSPAPISIVQEIDMEIYKSMLVKSIQ